MALVLDILISCHKKMMEYLYRVKYVYMSLLFFSENRYGSVRQQDSEMSRPPREPLGDVPPDPF